MRSKCMYEDLILVSLKMNSFGVTVKMNSFGVTGVSCINDHINSSVVYVCLLVLSTRVMVLCISNLNLYMYMLG